MKRLVFIAFVLLLLGGGGGGAAYWWYFMREAEPSPPPVVEAPQLRSKLIDFALFVIPVIREGRVVRHVTLKVVLQVSADEDLANLEEITPRLKDAFFSELHSIYGMRTIQDSDDPLPILKKRLILISKRLLGAEVLEDILVRFEKRRRIPGA